MNHKMINNVSQLILFNRYETNDNVIIKFYELNCKQRTILLRQNQVFDILLKINQKLHNQLVKNESKLYYNRHHERIV